MSGICGIVHADRGERADEARLLAMARALEHRGPDDAGSWHGGNAGLAVRRLNVIDLFRGKQPMLNEEGTVILVYDGVVYNYRELRDDLEARGHVFRTLSDTEVVLRAYEEFGDDALLKFNGVFALAVYDARHDRLLLARDRVGLKPLVYTIRNRALYFASELGALLQAGVVRGAICPGAIEAYFSFLYIPGPDTIFRDVFKLPPAHKLVYQRGELRVQPYWQLELKPDRQWTVAAAEDRYVDILTDAMRRQCVSDVPLGAFFSGGLDSCSVVALMRVTTDAPVKTFTVGFDDSHADDVAQARAAAQRFETDHTEELLKPDLTDTIPYLTRFFGEPFGDPAALPIWLVAQVARRSVAVALCAEGGDELFAGSPWLQAACRVQRYQRVPAPVRYAVDGVLRLLPRGGRFARYRRFSRASFLDPVAVFRERGTCIDREGRNALYAPELAMRIAQEPLDRFLDHVARAQDLAPGDAMLYLDFHMGMPDNVLARTDRMSMAHGLDARAPLLDDELIDFAATLPFDLKLRGGLAKFLVKRALGPIMPAEMLRERRRRFAIPVESWFRGPLRGHFLEVVLGHDARNTALLNRRAIRALFDAHQQGLADHGAELWAILMFEHWLRYADAVPGVSLSM